MNKFLLLTLLIAITNTLFAQHNFQPASILKDGSYIEGEVDAKSIKSNAQKCIFKAPDNTIAKYTPTEITGYEFTNGKRYLSIEFDSSMVFMEFVVDGRISLFAYRDTQKDYFFASKEGGKLIELKNTEKEIIKNNQLVGIKQKKEYIGILSALMGEVPEIQAYIANTKLETKSLIFLIKKYHDMACPNNKCHVYEKKFDLKFSVGPELGFVYSNVKFWTIDNQINSFKDRIGNDVANLSIGIESKLTGILGINEKLYPSIAVLFTSFNYQIPIYYYPSNNINKGKTLPEKQIKTSMIKIPVAINYQLQTNKKIIPVIGAGISVDLFLKNSIRDEFPQHTEEYKNAISTTNQFNIFAHAGINYKQKSNNSIQTRLTYERGNGIVNRNNVAWGCNTNQFYLNIAYLFLTGK